MSILKSRFRPEDGNKILKEKIVPALEAALKELAGQDLHVKVMTSVVYHEPLVPQGDKFSIHVVVSAYPKIKNAPE